MTDAGRPRGWPPAVVELLRSAAFARAFSLTAIGAAFAGFAIERVTSHVTYVTLITGLCGFAIAMLIARRRELSFLRLAPTSVLAFLGWALISVFWTRDQSDTFLGWMGTLAFALLAVAVAHVRDTLQTARTLGDVMRWLLSVSLGIEILAGILWNAPLPLLGVQGHIADLGPVQGIFGTRNALGFVAVIALVTFLVEWRTTSVRPGLSVFSVVLAGVLAVLSDSPTVLVIGVVVAVATLALTLVRRAAPAGRAVLQWTLGAVLLLALAILYVTRSTVIAFLGAGSDFSTRANLWSTILDYVRAYPVQGWGWYGPWAPSEFPFLGINVTLGQNHASALNAYFDVLVQLGWLGLLLFVFLCGFALVRSWLDASERRAVVYTWTPLILITLLVDSMFESFTLQSSGWFMLVLCATRAGLSRSWRERVHAIAPAAPTLPHDGDVDRPGGVQGRPGSAG
jgi:O-antigen ligase